jgi:4-hydroxybenzoate polyprenyltransferase
VSIIKNLFLASRPNQWTKNLLVFLAPLFAFSFETQTLLTSIKAFIAFCLISSSIYLINDSIDKNKDKEHPTKKFRAIASGLVSIKSAFIISLVYFSLSLIIGFSINIFFGFILILYFLVQILYCFKLKQIPIIEFFCIASGFILRSVAGGVAANIFISSWFLLSVGMLSLFLAVEKRKAEIVNLQNSKLNTRKVLKSYSLTLINKFEAVLTSSTIMTYSLWAYGPSIGGSKSPFMIITIPLVMLGIFRYQMLSEIKQNRILKKSNINLETPEKIIFTDKPIQIIVLTWLLIIIYIGFAS